MRIIKNNHIGNYLYEWQGEVIQANAESCLVKALFAMPVHSFGHVDLVQGDLFIETYYSQRFYNIFEVHDGLRDEVKVWYINLSRPAIFSRDAIRWDDLALDLLLYPDGKMELLDTDEFAALKLERELRIQCWQTVDEIIHNPSIISPFLGA